MHPRIISVMPHENYTLTITFSNREVREFDVHPYLEKGIFHELKDKNYFKLVKCVMGTVQWPHEQDFCPDTLYEESKKIAEER